MKNSSLFLCKQMNRKNIECNKHLSNMIKVRGLGKERHMKEIKQNVDYGNKTIKLILQFPDDSQDTAEAQAEVKSILTCALREQIRNGAVMYDM